MQYFDLVQLGDAAAAGGLASAGRQAGKFRRAPPLLRHAGDVSTKDAVERREAVAANARFDADKRHNPK